MNIGIMKERALFLPKQLKAIPMRKGKVNQKGDEVMHYRIVCFAVLLVLLPGCSDPVKTEEQDNPSSPAATPPLLEDRQLEQEKEYTSMEEALNHPEKVYKLNLSQQGLKEIPEKIFRFKRLQHLNLAENSILDIPAAIGQLHNLQFLKLSKNHIRELPPEIGQLRQLVELDLNDNMISDLPEGVTELTRLEVLLLGSHSAGAGNAFRQFPAEIWKLTALKTLSLQTGVISSIPPEISQLSRLETLDLYYNKLSHLPDVSGLKNLRLLRLGHNNFSEDEKERIIAQLPGVEVDFFEYDGD